MAKPNKYQGFTPGEKVNLDDRGVGSIKRAILLAPGVSLVAITFPSGPVAGFVGRVMRNDDEDKEE